MEIKLSKEKLKNIATQGLAYEIINDEHGIIGYTEIDITSIKLAVIDENKEKIYIQNGTNILKENKVLLIKYTNE